ncbi:NAD(P)-linked oxidoreductase superfamily protein [Klebsormidium nitens]|uniref:NAD(P)-linked oxidoreductase superfamily protein n=1 Tax=Klebsormidium nitens TaxID=105231 RepID=A0A1Y1HJG0_KLENI|nr:NAD(P)-linked oxidoreductase superfamily protein [Klebsormidium nitens]|eukprot:GAQ77682.1 NAD(P)-linked oxidoreductase superfamily protein [Klebsormidium nitens]
MALAKCMHSQALPLSHPLSTPSLLRSTECIAPTIPLLQRSAKSGVRKQHKAACRAAVSTGAERIVKTEDRIQLGKSSVEVSPIGVGAWAWGDKFFWNDGSWTDEKIEGARQAYETTLSSGLNFFDTAEVYGTAQFGSDDSESLLGRYIKESKQNVRPIVATKFAPLPWRLGKGSVVAAVKQSLSRLQMDQIDLYQLHWPGIWGNEWYLDGLAEAVNQGLVKAVGVSNYKEDRLRAAHARLAERGIPLASNQVHYNLLYRLPEKNGVKRTCDELGVTLIAYSPLAQGILSGKYTPEKPPSGPRGTTYGREFLSQSLPLLKRLKQIGRNYGDKTSIQVALNWLIAQGNVVPIPGAKSRAQAEEFAGALGWSLSDEEVQELRELSERVPPVQGFPVEAW